MQCLEQFDGLSGSYFCFSHGKCESAFSPHGNSHAMPEFSLRPVVITHSACPASDSLPKTTVNIRPAGAGMFSA
jgi:hypothetical protein